MKIKEIVEIDLRGKKFSTERIIPAIYKTF